MRHLCRIIQPKPSAASSAGKGGAAEQGAFLLWEKSDRVETATPFRGVWGNRNPTASIDHKGRTEWDHGRYLLSICSHVFRNNSAAFDWECEQMGAARPRTFRRKSLGLVSLPRKPGGAAPWSVCMVAGRHPPHSDHKRDGAGSTRVTGKPAYLNR